MNCCHKECEWKPECEKEGKQLCHDQAWLWEKIVINYMKYRQECKKDEEQTNP